MPVGRWVMRTAEFGLVDVLTAGAARAQGVDPQIGFVDGTSTSCASGSTATVAVEV